MTLPPNAPGLDELTAARLERYIKNATLGQGAANALDRARLAVDFYASELDRVNARLAAVEAKEAERSRADGDGR